MKKVVVLGEGTGMSTLFMGLKQYPLNMTAIVTACDEERNTGVLRKKFSIPAVGNIRRVLVSLSETESLVLDLFNPQFNTTNDLYVYTIRNLLFTAFSNITKNLSDGIDVLSKVLNLQGKVVPLAEDNVILMSELYDGTIIEGEHNITSRKNKSKIKKICYKEKAIPTKESLRAIKEADLIVLSLDSLFPSTISNLLIDGLVKEIEKRKAKIMYVCNMMTQSGEIYNFTLSDYINKLNEYLGSRNADVVLENVGKIDSNMACFYEAEAQKNLVLFDSENLENTNLEIMTDDLTYVTKNNLLIHDNIKLGFHVFYY